MTTSDDALLEEFARLGCVDLEGTEPDAALSVLGLGDYLFLYDRQGYEYLCTRGYAAYWTWVAEQDPEGAHEPWLFRIDNAGEPAYVCWEVPAERLDAVLTALRALPIGTETAAIYAALDTVAPRTT
jgi:hypothetical protein